MTGGFDANVPTRKPRTKIARVISELRSEAPDEAEVPEGADDVEAAAPRERDAVAELGGNRAPGAEPTTVLSADVTRLPGPPKAPVSRASGGHEQIARLRERLAAATHLRSAGTEPKRTAHAVREVVDGLRERLEVSARERSELTEALEEARGSLARAEADLKQERRTREALQEQAEERRHIADDAVAEAEALAAERDQVLGELAEYQRLDTERTSLLTEIEAALADRDAEAEAAARELAEARDLIDARVAEIADLEARLRSETAARARANARCQELEVEIGRLSEARDALESIETTLGHRRESHSGDSG